MLIQRAKRRLEKLGFFETVEISTVPGSEPDQVVIVVDVVDKSTGEFSIGAGYATSGASAGPSVEASITERNFLGRGQYLRIAVGASQAGRTFDFSFTEPRFMGLKVSAGVDAYHRINDENSTSYYGTEATGGQLRIGVPLTSALNAQFFGGYERKVIKDTDGTYTSTLVTDGQEFNKAFIGYTLTWNGVDDVKSPTEGLYATFTQQYIGWDHNLLRSEARARYFVPLIPDSGIVASVRGQAGVINSIGGGAVHAVEAFTPGSQLIRGFESRGYGPRLASGEYLGTTMYAGISGEIEFPIPGLPESYGLSGAVWADAAWIDSTNLPGNPGTVAATSNDQPLRTSVGASLIWDSPFGPLRGDFAHVLNKSTDDRTQLFQFTISTLL